MYESCRWGIAVMGNPVAEKKKEEERQGGKKEK
jgi:hypothetical protein